jgi:hypothetical protein
MSLEVVSRTRFTNAPDVPPEYVRLQQSARLVGNFFEELGNLVKNRVVDFDLFMDQYCSPTTYPPGVPRIALSNPWPLS